MKLCKDCVWIRYGQHHNSLLFSLKTCESPMYDKKIDLVDGSKMLKECCDLRSDSRMCGEEGEWFNKEKSYE